MIITSVRETHARSARSAASLLLAASEGDTRAWEELVERYDKLIFPAVRSFWLQEADTLDAVQMTWLRLAESVHRVQYPEHLGGWLVTTARRECLRILRQAKLAPRTDGVADNVVDPSAGPEQHYVDAATAQTLWDLVAELSPRKRTLLRALFANHPSPPYADVARITGIPVGSIGPTRARALEQLRRRLEEYDLR